MSKRIYLPYNNLIAFALLMLLGCFAQVSAQWTTPDGSGNISNTNSGNVGIGTSTPNALLEIKKSIQYAGSSIILDNPFTTSPNSAYSGVILKQNGTFRLLVGSINDNNNTSYGGPGAAQFWNFANGPTLFANNNIEAMRLTAGGNLGIGTATPGEKLVTMGNMLVGSITSHTQLYPGYDAQSNVIMELGSGTATSDVTPLASFVLSKNLTSTSNAIGVIAFANSSIASGDKRVASIGAATDGALNSGTLTFGTTNAGLIAEQMRITPGGYVGIGTSSPTERLEVAGNIKVSGNINAKYQDVAEWVDSAEDLGAGTVVILDVKRANHVMASTASYDTRVAGVISDRPGITLGEHADGKVLVATTGRVKIKVSAKNGPINIGDLLVTSDQPGVAMKSTAVEIGGVQMHRPGTLIGKALEPMAQGTGEILVLLSLQ